METNLTQTEADSLRSMEKHRVDKTRYDYPSPTGRIMVPLVSADRHEKFSLDLRRARVDFIKGTYQNRGRQTVILARLDFGGAPHRNPDGEEMGPLHLHLYREGYGDKWARPVPDENFSNLDDPLKMLEDFMRFCNITEPPIIQRGLLA